MHEGDFTRYYSLKPEDYHPKTENGVIVEIGPGEGPIFQTSERVLRRIEGNALYVGVDYERKTMMHSKKYVGDFVCGELTELPLANGIADELWMMNVFGEYHTSIAPDEVITELARVLKPSGTIIIGELYTPAKWLLKYDFQKLGLQRQIFAGEGANSFINKYGITGWITRHFFIPEITGPFFMTLTRNTKRD